MRLVVLEDYVADKMLESESSPSRLYSSKDVANEVWEIMLVQEQRIPDVIFDGDQIAKEVNIRARRIVQQYERMQEMKKIAWLGVTAVTALITFLIGFFVAP